MNSYQPFFGELLKGDSICLIFSLRRSTMNVYLAISLLQYKNTNLQDNVWKLLVTIPYSTKTQIPLGCLIWLVDLLLINAFLSKKYFLLEKITEFTKAQLSVHLCQVNTNKTRLQSLAAKMFEFSTEITGPSFIRKQVCSQWALWWCSTWPNRSKGGTFPGPRRINRV